MKIAKLIGQYSYKIIAFDKNYDTGWIVGAWKIKEKFLNDKGFKEISSKTISRLFEEGDLLPWISYFCKKQERKVKKFYYNGNLHFEL